MVNFGFSIENYGKGILVKGSDTKEYAEKFKGLNGKWNPTLQGWIFSPNKREELEKIFLTNKQGCKFVSPDLNKDVIKDINSFCKILSSEDFKNVALNFLKLPDIVQCMFLHSSFAILKNSSKYSNASYLFAYKIFRIFLGDDAIAASEDKESFYDFKNRKDVTEFYNIADKWYNAETEDKEDIKKVAASQNNISSSALKKSRIQNYSKELQKRASPESDTDPLYIFYTTLYQDKPDSRLAITWLTEHGVYDGEEREKLVKKYKKLQQKNMLLK